MSGRVRLSPGVYSGATSAAAKPKAKGMLAPVVQHNPATVTDTNPYGTSTYTQDAAGNISRNTALSAPEQQRYDTQNALSDAQSGIAKGMLSQVGNAYSQPFSTAGLPPAADYSQIPNAQSFSADRQHVEDSLYNNYKSRLDKQFGDQQQQLQQQLANQGVPMGSAAYQKQMDQLAQQQNDAYTNASAQAAQAGGAEQSRMFGLSMDSLNAQQGAHTSALQEATSLRDRPMNEFSSFMQTMPGVNNPQFDSTGALQNGNIAQQGQDLSLANFNKKPAGGGGGGGGGGRGSGVAGPQMQAQPQYDIIPDPTPKQPSAFAQLGQGLIGGFIGGAANAFGNSLFGNTSRPGGGRSIFGGM